MPAALPRTARLRRPAEFDAVRSSGISARDSYFWATAARRSGNARIGMAVSRRVSKRAVVRNRIKRQIRESFRIHRSMLEGLDVVIVALPAAVAAPNSVLARSLSAHWQRLIRKCAGV